MVRKAAASLSAKATPEANGVRALPSRQSARNANKRFNTEYGGADDETRTPAKKEDEPVSSKKANTGVKRDAPVVDQTPPSAKRVKIELPDDDEVKAEVKEEETGLPSPEESGSELSEPDEGDEGDESEFSDKDVVKPKKAAKVSKTGKGSKARGSKTMKSESDGDEPATPKTKASGKAKSAATPANKEAQLQAKKLKSYNQFAKTSPFPDFPHPTPDEARLGHRILQRLHGERTRPETVVARSDRAGCGDSPTVLDALVRTILSQNTSDKNSTRAKIAMDQVYGGSDQWDAILEGGQAKLQEAIKSGGLSVVKSKVIISILEQTKEKYGKYSLDHLFDKSDEEAMTELIGMKGVGPKTASCVLLFCLKRESFAVDTHVYRIAGLLGWRPKSATRDETHAHLEVMIPDEEKYGLHILMVGHGKKCDECKAGGKSVGKCELRKAFRQKKLDGEVGDEIKEEEEEIAKDESGSEEVKMEDVESGQEEYVHGMQGGKKQDKKQSAKATSKSKSKRKS